jgi:hypothetical protein
MIDIISAIVYAILSGLIIIFQICLAFGLPWGAASMGGKYPGKYPPKMRVVAIINVLFLSFLALIVLIKSRIVFLEFYSFSEIAIWFVVVFSFVGTILNSITPSKIERIWAPVAGLQFIASLIVAIG